MTPSTFTPAPPPKPNNTPFSWLRLTASLSIVARYTFTIWRGAVRLPTDTVFGRSATEWSPSATELFTAFANIPTATDKALALVFRPNAIELCCAPLSGPIAIAPVYPSFPAEAFAPIAIAPNSPGETADRALEPNANPNIAETSADDTAANGIRWRFDITVLIQRCAAAESSQYAL